MSIRIQSRSARLLYRIFFRNSKHAHEIPFVPQKTVIPPPSDGALVPVSPESVGLSSAYLDRFLSALEGERGAALHSLAIAKDGQTVCLASAPGYEYQIRHQTHSLCKTVTGLAVGILVEEGRLRLEDRITELITDDVPTSLGCRMRAVTVRHLLTMTSGVTFAEAGAITEENWVRAYLSSAVAFVPGTRFFYNSMNSYMLSVIVESVTGMTLAEFARERIFAPLGIRDTLWESCPRGHTKGGWGLYLSAEDCLRIGQMILDGGTYGGRRILSSAWIRQMCHPHAKTPKIMGEYNYGFHIWVARDGGSILCNGMLGQNIWISGKNRLVLVTLASNCELFPTGPMIPLVNRYFSTRLPAPSVPDPGALRRLRGHEARFFEGRTLTRATDPWQRMRDGRTLAELWDSLARGSFAAEPNNLGLLPIFVMLMQNNLSAGIRRIALSHRGEEFFLTVFEGEQAFCIGVGFDTYRESRLDVRGEVLLVRARAEFYNDAEGSPILRLELLFPELASARQLCLYYEEDRPRMILSEEPGRQLLDSLVALLEIMPRAKLLGRILRRQMGREMIARRIRACYEPTLRLKRCASCTAKN